jgi:hypothetical protein
MNFVDDHQASSLASREGARILEAAQIGRLFEVAIKRAIFAFRELFGESRFSDLARAEQDDRGRSRQALADGAFDTGARDDHTAKRKSHFRFTANYGVALLPIVASAVRRPDGRRSRRPGRPLPNRSRLQAVWDQNELFLPCLPRIRATKASCVSYFPKSPTFAAKLAHSSRWRAACLYRLDRL